MAISKKQLYEQLFKDYETSNNESSYTLKKQCDRLAGFAFIAMKHLEDNNMQDFVLLKHDGLRQWWHEYKETLRRQEEANLAKLRRAEIRAQALARLSDEEKEALGLKKK